MSQTAVTAASAEAGGAAAASTKRLLNLLETKSKERVLRLVTAFRASTLLEQEAFAQELGMTLPRDDGEHGGPGPLMRHRLQGPALGVQLRDHSYVVLAEPAAGSDCTGEELATLIKPFLTEKSLFTPVEDTKTALVSDEEEGETPTEEGGRENAPEGQQESVSSVKESNTELKRKVGEEYKKGSQGHPVLYRSRGYQALRLARGEQHPPVTEAYTTPSVLNLTGMPIDDADLWEWFDSMDITRDGTIGVIPFMETIKSLDRGFGLTQKAEQQLAEDVEALATDGKLTFDKFAFLVLRFSRH